LHRIIQPRRLRKDKNGDDDDDGGDDDDDDVEEEEEEENNQHVPSVSVPDKSKQIVTDETDRQNPAYVPRKGKFYEHDDRTVNGVDTSKQ
jgi:protein CASC3